MRRREEPWELYVYDSYLPKPNPNPETSMLTLLPSQLQPQLLQAVYPFRTTEKLCFVDRPRQADSVGFCLAPGPVRPVLSQPCPDGDPGGDIPRLDGASWHPISFIDGRPEGVNDRGIESINIGDSIRVVL